MLGDGSGFLHSDGEKSEKLNAWEFIDDRLKLNLDNTVFEISFSQKNLAIIKEKRVNLIGNGFSLKNITFTGPQFLYLQPNKINKSQRTQEIKLYFTENAEELVQNIKFKNLYNDLSKNINCYLSENKRYVFSKGNSIL